MVCLNIIIIIIGPLNSNFFFFNSYSNKQWASDLSSRLLAIHNEELVRRQSFREMFDGHFLNNLFTGMHDVPPAFAIEAPEAFDSNLPELTVDG